MKKIFFVMMILTGLKLHSQSVHFELGYQYNTLTIGGSANLTLISFPVYMPQTEIGWFGFIGTSYRYLLYDGEHNNLISIYPAIAFSAMGFFGYDFSFEPIYNINKMNFDRFHFRLEGSGFIYHASLYCDYIFYPKNEIAFGFTLGVGMPPFIPFWIWLTF